MEKIGILLVNLGTPDEPSKSAVSRYLGEFLMDPKVINISFPLRWLLVNGIILRTRPNKSAAAYRKVWTKRGSPLLFHSQDLTDGVKGYFGDRAEVRLAMRYGNPRLDKQLAELVDLGVSQIVVLPLYPQYAAATTGSTALAVYDQMRQLWNVPPVTVVRDFYDHQLFIEAFANIIRSHCQSFKPDHLLFSYHGLPENHLTQTSPRCLTNDCCDTMERDNRFCYRAQCYATSRCLSKRLELGNYRWSVSFQSRLGKSEWIKPYTTDQLKVLADSGVKRLAVSCPAFVADCLETIEEIGMEAKAEFIEHGGEDLLLIPSLNSSQMWIEAVCKLIIEQVPLKEN